MRKMKTYNKLPSPLLELAAWLAVMETAAWIAVEWLWPGVSVDLVMPILELLARSMGQNAASFPLPGVAQMHIALGIASAVAAAALAIDSSRRFHNGVWAGEKPSANGSYGSSRLLSRPAELKRAFRLRRKGKPGISGLVVGGIGANGDAVLVDDITHALVLGGTGSGKTTSCLLPSIVNLIDSEASFIALDPKGELHDVTGAYAERNGYKRVVIDFSDARTSDGWLPLQPAIDCAKGANGRTPDELAGEIRILADTLVPERREASQIWTQAARILFSGVAAFVAESPSVPDGARNLSTVAALAAMEQEDLQKIVEKLPAGSSARLALEDVAFSPAETYGGFRVNLATVLNVYADPAVSPMLARSDFSVEDFLEGKVALYVRFNSSSTAYDALVAAFVAQTMDGLRRLAERGCGGSLPRKVYWIMEEFPQLPKIAGLQKSISIIRSLGMSLVLVAQDRSQVEATYKEDAPAIFNNLDTTLFLAASDAKTCKHYSDALGSYTVETRMRSTSKGANGGGSSESVSYHEAKLFRPEDLAKWNWCAGHLVIKGGNAYACSSLPISKTFAGDALGLGGKEPDAALRASLAPERAASNDEPAQVWRFSDDADEKVEAIADAVAETADPRFL